MKLKTESRRPVIAIIADGSPDPAGQQTLENLDALIGSRFPGYDIRWAFQGSYMEGLKKRGQTTLFKRAVPIMKAADLFDELHSQGIKTVVCQLLMIHDSSYSRDALNANKYEMEVKFTLPFLSSSENRVKLIQAMEPNFAREPETATVMVGHGVFKDFEQSECFLEMDNYVRQNYRQVYVGTLHGPPGNEAVINAIKDSGCSRVRFVSLMLTTSDHVSRELMGDDPGSWKQLIGLPAELIDNLAENQIITDYFVNCLRDLLET